jgi:cell shape-determining protein MreC
MKEISRRNRTLQSALFSVGAAWGVLAAALIGVAIFFRAPLAGLLWRVAAPIIAARDALDATQNMQLRAQLARVQAQALDRDALAAENAELKALLGRTESKRVVIASVLLRPPATPYDTLTIDAGSAQGIRVGSKVSAGGSLIIGEVREVYPTTARVVLFSAPGETIDALLEQSNHAVVPIVLEGQGGGSFTAKVPAGTVTTSGALVSSPGIMGGVVGVVSYVDSKESDSFETLYTHLPVNPFSLRFVEIWLTP